jgi:Ca2+-binding RTX toxin-like protein
MDSRSAPPKAVAIVVALACGALAALPSTAAAVTCDRVGAALIVALDSSDLAGLDVSNGSIRVSGGSGQLIACSGTPAPTVNNIGAILVSNQPGSSSGSVIIENAGDFAPGSIIDGSDTGGTSEIEIYVNLNNASYSNLSVRDRGGFVRFGTNGINPNATPFEVAPDADIFPINVNMLEGRAGTAGNITDPGVLGAQGDAGTGSALNNGIELLGNRGNDQLTGGNGDDQLLAFNGNDTLLGMDGADTLQPGEDNDTVDGGPGVDKVDYLLNQNIPSVTLDLAKTDPQDTGGAGTDAIANVEDVDGTAGPDVLRGDSSANDLFASSGNDVIEGRKGRDTLQGWKGEDSIDARDGGPDKVDCGDDADKVVTDEPGVDTLIDCEQVSFAAVKGGGGGGGGGGNAARTFGRKTLVSLRVVTSRIAAKGPLAVRIANRNDFRVVARVSGVTKAHLKLKAKRILVPAHAARTGKLRLSKPLRRLLARNGRLALRLNVKLTDPLGNVRTFSKRLTARLKRG